MKLEERVTTLENRLDDVLGRLAAIQHAVFAVASESDLVRRQQLFEEVYRQCEAEWLARPVTDSQLQNASAGLNKVHDQLSAAFAMRLAKRQITD